MNVIVFILGGYLSGGLLFSYFIPKLFCKKDVTAESTDQNPGAANAFKYAGFWAGSASVLLDIAKGFVPVWLAMRFLSYTNLWFSLVLCAPVLGHAYPFWRLKGGGKGIAVSFGVLLGLLPQYSIVFLLAVLYVFFSVIVVVDPNAFRSVLTYLCFTTGAVLCHLPQSLMLGCSLISGIVIWKHMTEEFAERVGVRFFGIHKKNAL